MNNTLAIALLNKATNGHELLAVLDTIEYDYDESPVIESVESVVGVVPTLEEIAF